VPLIAEAGFTHFSLGASAAHSNYLTPDGQRHLKALAAQHGLAIDTIHGPRTDRPDGPAALSRAVAAASALGVPVLVVHGGSFDFPEAELADRLARFDSLDPLVLICHAPPHGTALDRVRDGVHAGSRSIRDFVDRRQPEYLFCGHIHEAEGVEIVLGKTKAVNVGKRGYLLELN